MSPSRAGALAAVVLALVAGGVVVGITAFDAGDDGGAAPRALPGVPPLRDPDQLAPDEQSGRDQEQGSDAESGSVSEAPLRIGSRPGGSSAGGSAPGPTSQLPLAGLLPVGGVPAPGLPIDVPLPPVPVPPPVNPPGVAQAITVAVEDVAGNPSLDALVVYVNGVPRERFVYPDADIAGLVAQINSTSTLISATLVVDGVPLAHSPPAAVQGGLDLPAAGGLPVSPLRVDTAVGAVTSTVAEVTATLSLRGPAGGGASDAQATADRGSPPEQRPQDTTESPATGAPPESGDTSSTGEADPAPASADERPAQSDPASPTPVTGTGGTGGGQAQNAGSAEVAPTPTADTAATAPPAAAPAAAPAD